MSVPRDHGGQTAQRARRRAARQTVAGYHEQQLAALLERVRDAIARLDRGEIDVFEVDALIERYDLAARKLRAFCGSTGADWERAADMLEFMRETARRTTGGTPPRAAAAEPPTTRSASGRREMNAR